MCFILWSQKFILDELILVDVLKCGVRVIFGHINLKVNFIFWSTT